MRFRAVCVHAVPDIVYSVPLCVPARAARLEP